MRLVHNVTLAVALALAACGGSKAAKTAEQGQPLSSTDVAGAVADVPTPQPGEYTTHRELLDIQMPGASPQMLDRMRTALSAGPASTSTYCVAAADAADMRRKMLQGMANGPCTFSHLNVSGTHIDGALECHSPDGKLTNTATMDGTLTANSSDMTMTVDRPWPSGGTMHLKMRVTTQRTGECSQ